MMKKGLFLLLLLWLWMIPAEAAYQPQYSVAASILWMIPDVRCTP